MARAGRKREGRKRTGHDDLADAPIARADEVIE
jgi:hypothetical protein